MYLLLYIQRIFLLLFFCLLSLLLFGIVEAWYLDIEPVIGLLLPVQVYVKGSYTCTQALHMWAHTDICITCKWQRTHIYYTWSHGFPNTPHTKRHSSVWSSRWIIAVLIGRERSCPLLSMIPKEDLVYTVWQRKSSCPLLDMILKVVLQGSNKLSCVKFVLLSLSVIEWTSS